MILNNTFILIDHNYYHQLVKPLHAEQINVFVTQVGSLAYVPYIYMSFINYICNYYEKTIIDKYQSSVTIQKKKINLKTNLTNECIDI